MGVEGGTTTGDLEGTEGIGQEARPLDQPTHSALLPLMTRVLRESSRALTGRESSSCIYGDMGGCSERVGGWKDGRKLTVTLHTEQGDRYVERSHALVLPGTQGSGSGGDSEPEPRTLNRDDFNLTKTGTRL